MKGLSSATMRSHSSDWLSWMPIDMAALTGSPSYWRLRPCDETARVRAKQKGEGLLVSAGRGCSGLGWANAPDGSTNYGYPIQVCSAHMSHR